MKWNKHPEIKGTHAILSASKYAWLRKTDDELIDTYMSSWATMIGTILHDYAAGRIKYRMELADTSLDDVCFALLKSGIPACVVKRLDMATVFPTVMRYVNDSISYGMDSEVELKYSELCYGTADAIQYRRKKLRIYDLKTGATPAKIDQLMIYAALFYLEYGYKPEHSSTELRIYQADDILLCEPTAAEVREVMDILIHGDEVLQGLASE